MKKKMRKCLLFLLLLGAGSLVWADDYEDLIEEHKNYDWEAVSLDLLADEMEHAAREEGLTNFQVYVHNETISLIYRDLQFPPNSPEITDETREKIVSLTNVLSQFSGKNLLLEGHTAAVPGDDVDGVVLSGERSSAVADEIAATGTFPRNRIEAIGQGEYKPIADNETPEGRELNRRVEVSIVNKVEGDDISSDSIWWNQLTSQRAPGYSLFMLSHDMTDEYSVEYALEEAGYDNLPVYYTREGVAVIYDDAGFDENGRPTAETRDNMDEIVTALTGLDPFTQMRIGGKKEAPEDIGAEQYNLGKYTAYKTDIRGGGTLVGDYPYTYNICGKGGKGMLAGLGFSLNQSLPLSRYGEFSQVGLGAGTALSFKIPSLASSHPLSPLRFVIALEGLYHIPEATSSVDSMLEFDWLLGAGYKIGLTETFALMPLVSYGGTVHTLDNVKEIDSTTFEAQEGGVYYSQTVAGELDINLAPEKWETKKGARLSVFFRPGCRVFFDEDYLGTSVTAKTGIRINY